MSSNTRSNDRLDLLNRGRKSRAVNNRNAHIDTGPVDLAAVPAPYETNRHGALNDSERLDLETCEQAVAHLQRSIGVAGKALATIHAARLYRETHPTFDAYVSERWGMKRSHAYRMVEGWPVAAALSPIGDTNEAQVRELVPVAKAHGLETATAVYAELKEHGGRITAARIRDAVQVLPADVGTPEQARAAVRRAAVSPIGDTGNDTGPPKDTVQDGRNPVAVLASIADRQRRLYDELGGGLIDEALTAEPGRAEMLLRDIARDAGRTTHRARTGRSE
ncbi:hypothetical protein [Streptomyces sp. sk226]|uniref:hypothetical protein n=1 Tax=Streptomyces sp. sk226 TaxID=2034268 RepID=UPI000BF15D94|nr:hypothetical protein [Streptomyces sp. sk226]